MWSSSDWQLHPGYESYGRTKHIRGTGTLLDTNGKAVTTSYVSPYELAVENEGGLNKTANISVPNAGKKRFVNAKNDIISQIPQVTYENIMNKSGENLMNLFPGQIPENYLIALQEAANSPEGDNMLQRAIKYFTTPIDELGIAGASKYDREGGRYNLRNVLTGDKTKTYNSVFTLPVRPEDYPVDGITGETILVNDSENDTVTPSNGITTPITATKTVTPAKGNGSKAVLKAATAPKKETTPEVRSTTPLETFGTKLNIPEGAKLDLTAPNRIPTELPTAFCANC